MEKTDQVFCSAEARKRKVKTDASFNIFNKTGTVDEMLLSGTTGGHKRTDKIIYTGRDNVKKRNFNM